MAIIQEVKDEDIFIKTNSLTNMIKGKKLRKQLLDNGIKVEIVKASVPLGIMNLYGKKIRFVFHRPPTTDKKLLSEIVGQVSDVVWKRYDCGHFYEYVDC